MKVCYTALFGNYEELKEPAIITPGWKYVCYTDQPLKSDVWEIKQLELRNGATPQKLARCYKIKEFAEWEQSIWIDASFVINTDLNAWWEKYFKKGFSAPKHPLRNCIYDEGKHCMRIKRGAEGIEKQLTEYKSLGIPKKNGLITSGLLMRENTPEVIALCKEWWTEMSTQSIRDQIAFGKASLNANCVYTYPWDYRESNYFIYKKHYHLR